MKFASSNKHMKKPLILFLSFFFLFLMPLQTIAISIYDWKSEGDNCITYDELSGLEWLDPIQTFAMAASPAYPSKFESGGYFEGFRLATLEEVLNFWSLFGLPQHESFIGSTPEERMVIDDVLNPFLDLMGMLSLLENNNSRSYYLRFDDLIDDGFSGISLFIKYANETNIASANYSIITDVSNYQNVGAWLVRETTSTVPEPSTMLLFGVSILCVAGLRIRFIIDAKNS